MKTKPIIGSPDRDTFRAILEGAALNPQLGVISNRFPWQARMASEKLLEVAALKRLPVRILSGGGAENFYTGQFATALRACKTHVPWIKILVWQRNAEGLAPCLKSLAEDGTVELRISGTEELSDHVPHFLLVGDRAFRQEATHRPFSKHTKFSDIDPEVPARIDFDDLESGKTLENIFDTLWK